MTRIRRMDGEARTTMTVTLDPTLLRWVSRGANRSETVETIIRSAWRKNMAHQRGMAKNHKDLMDPAIRPIYFLRSFLRPRSSVRIFLSISRRGFILIFSRHVLPPWRVQTNNLASARSFFLIGIQNSSRIDDMHCVVSVLASPARPQAPPWKHLHLGYH